MRCLVLSVATWMLSIPMLAACQAVSPQREASLPQTPASVKAILAAHPFTLRTPFTHASSKERPSVSSGVLVVLDVDPNYVIPRQTLEPVLYAGDTTVLRLNQGQRSGKVIGIVPGNVDLATVPIWFGTPELPERVTVRTIASERALAEKSGVRPLGQAALIPARRTAVSANDLAELLRTVGANLVLEFSPQEKELADSWRLPVAKPPGQRTN